MKSYSQYDEIFLNLVQPYPQAESLFPKDGVREMAEQLRQHGMTGFLVVRPNEDKTFGLISGMKLYQAAISAGLSKVPCLLRNLPEADALGERLREIIHSGQRDFEEALAYQIGIERFGWTTSRIHAEFGRSVGHISEKLGLVEIYQLEPDLLQAREARRLSDRAVIALRRVLTSRGPQEEKVARVRQLAKRMLDERWPASIAAPMVMACLRAMDQGLPLPPTPERGGGRQGLLKAEIEDLERQRDALLAEVTALKGFAESLSPFWAEAQRIQGDIQRFVARTSEIKWSRGGSEMG